MGYRVKGTPVAVSLGPEDGSQVVQFIDAGGTLPSVPEAQVKHLLLVGLIEAVDDGPSDAPAADGGSDQTGASEAPRKGRASRSKAAAQDEDLSELAVEQLLAQAAARGIEVPEGITDRADLIAILSQ